MECEKSQDRKGNQKRALKKTKNSLGFIDGLMSSKEFGVGATIPKVQKGSVVLRGDIAKDDSGAYAVFTEQGLPASQMTAAKVMDVIARLPDCDGQHVRMYGYVFQNISGRSHGNTLKILLFLMNETCTDTHSQDSCGKDSLKKH